PSCQDTSEIAGFRAAVLIVRTHLPPVESQVRTIAGAQGAGGRVAIAICASARASGAPRQKCAPPPLQWVGSALGAHRLISASRLAPVALRVGQDKRPAWCVGRPVTRALTVLIMDGPGRLGRIRPDRDRTSSGGKRPPDPEAQVVGLEDGGVPGADGRAEHL